MEDGGFRVPMLLEPQWGDAQPCCGGGAPDLGGWIGTHPFFAVALAAMAGFLLAHAVKQG